mgnify:CR=1 FL=1
MYNKNSMEEKNYNTDELNVCINDIKTQLNRIEGKQDFTNGRVRKLEIWKGYLTGGLAILTVLVLPLIFLAVQSFLDKAI